MNIQNNQQFVDALASLGVDQQRKAGLRFIEQVIDLDGNPRIRQLLEILARDPLSAEDLKLAHDLAHSVYVETHPRSDLLALDFKRQAAHFIAEACAVCSAPVYEQADRIHLAQKAAMYCRMARTCASMHQGGDEPDFAAAERDARKLVEDQMRIVQEMAG